jgi:hypothetical protein
MARQSANLILQYVRGKPCELVAHFESNAPVGAGLDGRTVSVMPVSGIARTSTPTPGRLPHRNHMKK